MTDTPLPHAFHLNLDLTLRRRQGVSAPYHYLRVVPGPLVAPVVALRLLMTLLAPRRISCESLVRSLSGLWSDLLVQLVPVLVSVHLRYYLAVTYVAVNLDLAEPIRRITILYIWLSLASGSDRTRDKTRNSRQTNLQDPTRIDLRTV
jgi:hypothetical protein